MALNDLREEVVLKLIDTAWETAKLGNSAARQLGLKGPDSAAATIQELVTQFDQALDGFVRAYESAGTDKKAQ